MGSKIDIASQPIWWMIIIEEAKRESTIVWNLVREGVVGCSRGVRFGCVGRKEIGGSGARNLQLVTKWQMIAVVLSLSAGAGGCEQ